MKNSKIAAIVPALNEEKTIGPILQTLLNAPEIDEVILVDGGSKDKTVAIAEQLGVKVVKNEQGGKGGAMAAGIKNTDAEIIMFFDADLIGLNQEHINGLLQPVLKDEAVMCTAIRERGGWKGKVGEFFIKIDPLSAIAGERAIKRFVFESVPPRFLQKFMVETALNYFCQVNKLPVKYFKLKGLDIVVKEKKWGFWRGFWARLKMNWQMIKIRFLIFSYKKEFLKKDNV
ncbi:MAG: glycosyltransferase [Minisyncoccales bacterium]